VTSTQPVTGISGGLCGIPLDGRVVKECDDLMSATRYAVMMLRSAKTADFYDAMDRDIVYPNLGIY